jgi:hypothetical protein
VIKPETIKRNGDAMSEKNESTTANNTAATQNQGRRNTTVYIPSPLRLRNIQVTEHMAKLERLRRGGNA